MYVFISCKPLIVYFSLQVNNKPNDGIPFPVFILGARVVMNSAYNNQCHQGGKCKKGIRLSEKREFFFAG
jgi:hypothetical protein